MGVLSVLEAAGLKPDLIVGCSAGSLVGALYASGLTAAQVSGALDDFDLTSIGDIAVPGLGFLPSPLGLLRGDRLHEFMDKHAPIHALEKFPIRFAAVVTDLETGAAIAFNAGHAGLAVQASSAVPVLFAPARIEGRLYSDCQLTSPLPVGMARRLGASRVIAVDVVYPPEDAGLTSSMRVAFQALSIATFRLKEWEAAGADLVIAPDLPKTSGQLGLAEKDKILAAGAQAAEAVLPRIRSLFRTPP